MAYLMYVTISEEDKILAFRVDAENGSLEQIGETAVSGRPAPLAVDRERRRLFVGRRAVNQISSYRINVVTGGLEQIGSAPVETDPCYLGTDRRGRFLFSAYYNGGLCAVHAIGDDGAVKTPPIEWRLTGRGAHSMQTERTNRFAFVPHIANGPAPNRIFQFRFDEETGRLTPNDPPQAHPGEGAGPRHFCFHPTKNVVYFSNEQGCSVSAYNLDPDRGTLTLFDTVSTLPDDFTGSNSCAQIQISHDGRFVYAPNRGHNSIACFATDPATGGLTRVAIIPSERVPRAVSLDPASRHFYAAGLESGTLACYAVDQATGVLRHLQTYPVGKAPMWVMILPTE